MKHLLPLTFATVLASTLVGCNIEAGNNGGAAARPLLKKQIGEACTVQLRRESLGAAGELLSSPTSMTVNGADLAVRGRLTAYSTDGALINDGAHDFWIPASSILLISFP